MQTLDRWLFRMTASLVMALVGLMTLVIGLQVFCRYVLNSSLIWPEEMARYAMVWVTCLSSGIAVRQVAHMGVDSVVRRLPRLARRAVLAAGGAITLVFLLVLLVFGISMVGRVFGQTSVALDLPMAVPYAAVPVGAALMLYEHLRLLVGWGAPEAPADVFGTS